MQTWNSSSTSQVTCRLQLHLIQVPCTRGEWDQYNLHGLQPIADINVEYKDRITFEYQLKVLSWLHLF